MSLFSDIDMSGDFDLPSANDSGRTRGTKRNIRRELDDGDSSGDDSPTRSKKRRRKTADQVTPKPKQPELQKLTPDEQMNADFPSQQSTAALMPGMCLCFFSLFVETYMKFFRSSRLG